MPRDRVVTMGKLTPAQSHTAAIRKAIKLHSPYVVVEGELVGEEEPYAVVYTAPLGGDRMTIGTRNRAAGASKLRDQLNYAWAEGYWASSQKGKAV